MAAENKIKWVLAETKYKKGRTICVQVLTTDHPLQQIGDKFTKSHSISSLDKSRTRSSLQSSTDTCFVDPLSIVLDGLDPLTSLAANVDRDSVVNGSEMISSQKTGKPTESSESPASDLVLSWESVCTELRKFTTTYPLTLASSFLSFAETGVVKVQNNIPDRSKGTGQTNLERVKARLEKLDSLDEGGSVSGGTLKEMGGLTQEQFTQHLFFSEGGNEGSVER
ncbi:hypothetical protein Anas_00610 [Armadillidium nasatum]|uniref:Uncharacterized protein n=1 Tax=Armadillidium nasatum TaxID=96803 RepID=A0A5N5TPF3_9CRUS|nr:hypothetical protein Anas_00610 [Armadillidium nasatum]